MQVWPNRDDDADALADRLAFLDARERADDAEFRDPLAVVAALAAVVAFLACVWWALA